MLTLRPLACVALVLAAGLLGACAESRTPPDFMGNTNWLIPCDGDAECGPGLQCSCGLCTRECQRQAECGGLAQAVCDSNSDAFELACGQAEIGVCLPHCAQPGDCAADQQCVDSRCLPEQVAVGTVDAGPCEAGSCAQDAGIDARTVDAPDSSLTPPRDADVLPDAEAMPFDAEMPTGGARRIRCRARFGRPRCDRPQSARANLVCGAGFVCETAFETQGAIKDVAVGPSDLYLADWGTQRRARQSQRRRRAPALARTRQRGRGRARPTRPPLARLARSRRAVLARWRLRRLRQRPRAADAVLPSVRFRRRVGSRCARTPSSTCTWTCRAAQPIGSRMAACGSTRSPGRAASGLRSAGRDLDQAVEVIAGVDASYVYFEGGNNTGGLRRMSRSGMELDTVAIASSIFLATVRSDAFWFIHTDSQQPRLGFLRAKGRRRADPCSGR